MKGILDFLRKVGRNRYLYIGNASFAALRHMKTGYQMCLRDNTIQTDSDYERFEHFVRNSLEEGDGPISIWTLISNKAASDDEAFDMFFSLLRAFDAKHELDMRGNHNRSRPKE